MVNPDTGDHGGRPGASDDGVQPLTAAQCDAYLARIGAAGITAVNALTLEALHHAHLQAVPFENLDIHAGIPIELDIDGFFDKIVGRCRGGFCYELNGLFAALLRGLGFGVELLSGRVSCRDGGFGPEYDHLLLLVHLDEPWLADVGFGDGFRSPLRVIPAVPQEQPPATYRLGRDHTEWRLDSLSDEGWSTQYLFSLRPRTLGEFAGMCQFHQTSPDSPFTTGRLCSVATPTGRVTLRDDRLIVTRSGRREELAIPDDETFALVLRERFGILPDAPPRLGPDDW